MAFGAGMGEQLFGGQVGNVLTRVTVWLTTVFLVATVSLAYVGAKKMQMIDMPVSGTTPVEQQQPKPAMPQAEAPQAAVVPSAMAPAAGPAPVIPLDIKPVDSGASAAGTVNPVDVKPDAVPVQPVGIKPDAVPVQPVDGKPEAVPPVQPGK